MTRHTTSYAGSIPVARSTRTSAIAGEQAFDGSRSTYFVPTGVSFLRRPKLCHEWGKSK